MAGTGWSRNRNKNGAAAAVRRLVFGWSFLLSPLGFRGEEDDESGAGVENFRFCLERRRDERRGTEQVSLGSSAFARGSGVSNRTGPAAAVWGVSA
jgi:hypothetical protein